MSQPREQIHSVEFLGSFVRLAQFPKDDLPEVAFAGRSNVGKSSCLNVLVGRRNVARVSATPGRTQQLNAYLVDGIVRFVDLPGYGYAKAPEPVRRSWGRMIEDYLNRRENLKLMVLLVDIRRDPGEEERQVAEWLDHRGIPGLLVLTKADKVSRNEARRRVLAIGRALEASEEEMVPFSSLTRQGVEEVWRRIRQVSGKGIPGGGGPS
ncbi:ribosome biogenesis GTP-binding protein YihA/YsxC [Myxococcota bacterium]|nr:ribosome biogenesis GTP-binding protein YihA/YsxC [Myxococcota bacterium]